MSVTTSGMRYALRTEAAVKGSTAIWWWASVGAFCAALQIYVFYQWWASGGMVPNDPGVTPISGWMKTFLHANDLFWTAVIVLALYVKILRPLLKTRTLTFDAIFMLAFTTIWWQDPLYSYVNLTFAYNPYSFNLGGWACHIPGWISPNGCLIAEPLAMDFAFYFVLCTVPVFAACAAMRRIKAKYPTLRTSTIFIGWWALIAVLDLAFEIGAMAVGIWHYGGVPDHMSILVDTRLKFPLFEPVFMGISFVGYAALYYFRNDKGETLAERGLDQVNTSSAGKKWLQFFALSGAANAAIFLLFSVPVILFNLQADAWPKVVQETSYLTNGMCGEGTRYACGGKNVAMPRDGQAMNIGPDGEVTAPVGTQVPKVVPIRTTPE